jgi:regulator of PEP synthase PpsR (kinase-PPPase family)
MIKDTPLPPELFEVDQRKIFALTIDPDSLSEIRKNRLQRLGADKHTGEYAEQDKIVEEVEWANNIFKENKRWPVFNVTDKALEETAADIMKLLNMRKNNIFKQNKNENES